VIAIAAKRVEAGVAIRVEMVFPATAWEEVSRETVAFGTVCPLCKWIVISGWPNVLSPLGGVLLRKRTIVACISIQDRWAWIDTIEAPYI
jgi:hypothetical protein